MFDIDFPSSDTMPADHTPLLDTLNPEQRIAVETTEGPLLVLAGAGTGKTRVLTTRIAHILLSHKAYPSEILAVTFTNKAAKEMVHRIAGFIKQPVDGLWLGTFHSISARILRRHAEHAGLSDNFTIIDTDDQIRLLKQLLTEHNIDEKKWPAKTLLSIIQRWKDRGLIPEKVTSAENVGFANGYALALYRDYQNRLKSLNAVDFGDLLLHCLTLFTKHPDILEQYKRRFRYILVDEYQDTNVSQYLWLRLLTNEQKNICCVGDDDQSIYSWRGAEVGNILRFETDYPQAKIIKLECNYRSTSHILGAASQLIANNADRLGKTLWTETEGGSKIKISSLWDEREEARYIGGEIESLQQIYHHSLKDMAILVRAGYQTRAFEECFVTMGIPYKVIGGLRFYERKEIRDVIAYIRATVQPQDDLAFERIINVPKRGIGASTMQSLFDISRSRIIPLTEAAIVMLKEDMISGKTRNALGTLSMQFARWKTMFETQPHAEVVETMLHESGYLEMWQNEKSVEAEGRVDNIKELIRALQEFESIGAFLEHVSLVSDVDELNEDNMISIMTMHGAKGLEFDTVFLPGWEEGLFPSQRSLDETGNAGLEEERRLAYVAITRARKQVYISFAANRRVYNQWQSSIPSRFIKELPQEHVETYRLSSGLNYGMGRKSSSGFSKSYDRDTTADYDPDPTPYNSISFPKAQASSKASEADDGTFHIGNRVFHQKFGYGRVVGKQDSNLKISFDKAGLKTIIDSFVKKVPNA